MSHQMPGLNEGFFTSKSLTLAAAAIAFLAAAGLLSFIFRFVFRRRVRLPRNGRARLPRLGVVDAFDLDRQRQLVIIRRDNVEHLLMIGGPTDVVIESAIIRAAAQGRSAPAGIEARADFEPPPMEPIGHELPPAVPTPAPPPAMPS